MKNCNENCLKKLFILLFTCGIFMAMTCGSSMVYASNCNENNGVKVDGYYECEHPFIKELAANITKNLTQNNVTSRVEIAKTIYKWMHSHVKYEKPMYYDSKHYAVETAILGKGNCCDQARLFIALCRAAGIPHNATEFVHSGSVQFAGGNTYGHVWPVLTLENGTKVICDTSSSSSKLGKPTWKNLGSSSETYDLNM